MKLPDSIAASVVEAKVQGINDQPVKVWFIGFADGRRLLCIDQMASLLMPDRGVALLDLIKAGCDLITGRNVLLLISRLTKSHWKKRPKVGIENKQTTTLI
jgi:hypothetical protein